MDYTRPISHADARALLKAPGSVPLGGGTDLLVALREGLLDATVAVDLRAVPGLDEISESPDGGALVGGSATLHAIASHPVVAARFPALAQACLAVGSPALRHMGTLGGNLCQRPRCWYYRNAIPCLKSGGADCPAVGGENRHLAILGGGPCHAVHPSDPAVALTALDASVHIDGSYGRRTIPVADFFTLPAADPRRETVLAPGEFVAAIEVPAHSSGGRQRYVKALQRAAWDFALASVAVACHADGSVRIVLGGVAPVPWRINPSVEEDLAAGPVAEDDLDTLADRALHDARPLAGNAWKLTLAKALLRDAFRFATAPDPQHPTS